MAPQKPAWNCSPKNNCLWKMSRVKSIPGSSLLKLTKGKTDKNRAAELERQLRELKNARNNLTFRLPDYNHKLKGCLSR